MNTDIIQHFSPEVNDDAHAGIPCHDAGQPYPCWCPGCLEEADSRELIALRLASSASRYEVPEGMPDLDAYGPVPVAMYSLMTTTLDDEENPW